MLTALCGNKNVQRILIFLFVNSKCYGTQLHRALRVPLTPLQKALARLENGGIITSYLEGRTRVYQFNPAYPLLDEVEQLLKKTYTLLPAHQKKEFYVPKEESEVLPPKELYKVLLAFWERLGTIQQVIFHAHSKSGEEGGWNGKGKGTVAVQKEGSNVLLFHEKGSWQGVQGSDHAFTNSLRWHLDRQAGMILLEHLRHGANHPVFLLHLVPSSKHTLSSIDSHLCAGDTYFGQIHFNHYGVRLNWRVIGTKKNEEIDYHYF